MEDNKDLEREDNERKQHIDRKEDFECQDEFDATDYELEQEWADKLGMDFDPSRVTPPPVPEEFSPAHHNLQESYPSDSHGPVPPIPASYSPLSEERAREPMPPTFMLWAVLATICCCLPAGVVAIVFSSSVSSKYFARDYKGARRASRNAEIWIIVSIVAGIIGNTLYFPLMLMMPS